MLSPIVLTPVNQSAWAFDAPSFLIGLIVGLMIGGLLFVFRQPLGEGVQTLRERARQLRERLTAGAERRYLESLQVRFAELHVGELAASFDDLYLPPRFDPPLPRPSLSPSLDTTQLLSLHQALASTHRLAVLGESGSGRTALLVHLARIYAEHRAPDALSLDERRLPVLVHLAEIEWGVEFDDPADLLVDAAIAHVSRLVAANVASLLKGEIKGKGLVLLLDGWDEIAVDDRADAQTWLDALVQRHPDHRYVVTASPADVSWLSEAGFTGLTIAALQPRQIRALADRWAAAAEGGASDAAMLAEAMRQPPGVAPRPLDFTLAASVWLKRGHLPLSVPDAYDHWIDIALGEAAVTDGVSARAALARLAWTLFEEDRLITTGEETVTIASESPVPGETGKAERMSADIAGELAKKSALFVPQGQGVAFAHRRVAAYLAALHARDTGQAMTLATHLDDPQWVEVTAFFAALGDAGPLVNAALTQPDDLFRATYKRLTHWASIAPAHAAWRSRVMADVVKPLMSPATPEPLRDELLRLVVSTRDKGLPYLFKQALGRPDPSLRRLGLRGFGLLRREADVAQVAPLVSDSDPRVSMEALRALGEIGGQAAAEALAHALLELDDDARRVAAEALADCGKPGWELLAEGARDEDLRVRRAVAYGLARVGEGWARDVLVKLEREDKQWFVRSGATEALRRLDEEMGAGEPIDVTPLDPDNLGWLVQWSAQKGQPIGIGKSATQALQRALDDPDPSVRLAAVHTYAYLGQADIAPALRNRLKDENSHVSEAAYRALEAIARRTGEFVPQ